MARTLKTFYDSPRGKRERLRNRRITLLRKAYELESKCNAQVLVIIETSSKRYLYKSGNIDRVVKGATLEDIVEKSWPPFQISQATDFASERANASNTPSINSESSDSEQEGDDIVPRPQPKLPCQWDIKVVPSPPEIVLSPTMVRSADGDSFLPHGF